MAMLVKLTVLAIIQVLCALSAETSNAILPGFQECSFQGNSYRVGERFHPSVVVDGQSYDVICSECECHATTLVQCEAVQCPEINCNHSVRVDGVCCEICLDLDEVPTGSVTLATADPARKPTDCFYDGTYYLDGDTFHPDGGNDVLHPDFNATNPFCTTCKCEAGTTVCENITDSCPNLDCEESDQIVRNGECCPICKPFPVGGPGCQDHNGFEYEDGANFHPYYEVYGGYVPCLNCTCKGSTISCFKEECPPVKPCTDEDEYEDITICCPKCSRGGTPAPSSQPPSTMTTSPASSGGTSAPSVQTPSSPPTSAPTPTLQPCTTKYYYKLYLCPDGRSMVINNINNKSAQMFVWLENGAKQFIDMTSNDFQANECSDPQYYQGSTTKQRVNGLTGKESKKQKIENCTEKCASMVVQMLRPVDVPIDGC